MLHLGEVGSPGARPGRDHVASRSAPPDRDAVGREARHAEERGVASLRDRSTRTGRTILEGIEREVGRDRAERFGHGLTQVEGGARGSGRGDQDEKERPDGGGHRSAPRAETATGIAVRRGPRPSSAAASAATT